MNRLVAVSMLNQVVNNAKRLMAMRDKQVFLVDKIRVYPVELVSIYVLGSYLKNKIIINDLDMIALYRHTVEEGIILSKLGRRKTYDEATRKLIEGTENVDLQLYNFNTYDFTVNPYVAKELSIKIDKYQRVWVNEKIQDNNK